MEYKLDAFVSKIKSKIVLVDEDGYKREFDDGASLSKVAFGKRYRIESISVLDNKVEIVVAEIANNYTDKEAAMLFDGN